MTLPNVVSDSVSNSYFGSGFAAYGSGSSLNLPALASFSALFGSLSITATSGGQVSLPLLSNVTGSSLQLDVEGTGSQIDVSQLSGLNSGSSITDLSSGSLLFPTTITSLEGVSVTVDGTGTLDPGQFSSLTDGRLTVREASYTLPGLTDIDGTNLYVQQGGSLTLPNVVSYANTPALSYISTSFQASDAGSSISLPALVSITNDNLSVTASGNGASVDLSAATTYAVSSSGSLTATNSGSILLNSAITSLTGVAITLDGTGSFPINQFTSLTRGNLTITGGSYTLPNLTTIDGTSVNVQNGGNLTLPDVTTVGSFSFLGPSFQAFDSGSILNLPALTTLAGTASSRISAFSGGQILAAALTSTSTNAVQIDAEGANSKIDLSALGTINPNSSVTDINGATLLVKPTITSLANGTIVVDGTGTLPLTQFTSLTSESIQILGGTYALTGLTNINASSVTVRGANVSMPGITTYAASSSFSSGVFTATGDGSVLDLSHLTTDTQGSLSISAQGVGSSVDISSLPSFSTNSSLSATQHGNVVINPAITNLAGVSVTVDGTGTLAISQVTTLTNARLTVQGGDYTLPNLVHIDGSSLFAGGGSISLPNVTSYNASSASTSFQADRIGNLPGLIDLSHLSSLTTSFLALSADGQGSVVDLSGVTSSSYSNGSFSATNGGQILLSSNFTSLDGVSLTIDTQSKPRFQPQA